MKNKIKRQVFGLSSLLLSLLFGAVFSAVGVVAFRGTAIDSGWERVEGIVTDVSSHRSRKGNQLYAPVVSYEVNNETYEVRSRSSSSFYPTLGASREVAYNPLRPDQAKLIEGMGIKLFLLLFFFIGAGAVVTGLISFVKSFRRSKVIGRLLESSQKLPGVLVEVRNTGRHKGKEVYQLVVSAVDISGMVKRYVSDAFFDMGHLQMVDLQKNPIPVNVLVDSENPDAYYVDVNDMPEVASASIKEIIARLQQGEPKKLSSWEDLDE